MCFIKKNGQRRYKDLVLGRDRSYFVKHHSDSTKKFSETDIFNMLEFLIDNIFVMFGGRIFQQTVGMPMGTNCAPLLADLFLNSYEADFIQGLLKKNEKKLARSFNFTFRYIYDVLSLYNSRFGDFADHIYPIELERKDATDTDRSASYLDLHIEIDSEGRLRTKLYTKRDDFNFPIVNFPYICSNIPAAPTYGVYLSQMIRYSRACGSYQDFLDRGLLLTRKLLIQGFLLVKLKSWLRKYYGELVNRYGISVSQMTTVMFPHSRLITGFVTRLIPRVPLVEQELFTHLLSSKCPTFIFLLVIGVEHFMNYSTFLMHFSDLILLLWQLIIF